MNKKMIKALKAAFPWTIPVLTGFLFLGIAYGILMSSKGYGVLWTFLMSAVGYCGSMQFVAVTLLTSAFNPVAALFLSIMVNARHLFYGISMLSKYKGIGKIKTFLIYTLCDETFSVVSNVEPPKSVERKYFYFWISFLNYFYWIAGGVIGAFIGEMVNFDTKGLDFVLTALFVVIFLDKWEIKENRPSAFIGVICSVICLVIFGADNFIIPAMILMLVVLSLFRKRLEVEK